MNFMQELQQPLLNNGSYNYLKAISELSSSFNQIILFIISIIALFGAYFWYMDKNYYSRYLFKTPSNLEFLYDLVAKGIGGFTNSLGIFKFVRYLLIYLILVGGITYLISGIEWTILILFLGVIAWLKIVTLFQEIEIGEAIKNNNYMSPYVILKSYNIFLKSFKESLSKKLLYAIIYLLISIILFLVQIEYFYLWAIILIIIYGVKFCNFHYEFKLMEKRPLYTTVEYLSGDIEQSLILYETTATDYRFIHKFNGDEFIIPITSIKKMYYDYDSELDDWEPILNFKVKVIKRDMLGSIVVKIIDNIIISVRPIIFYRMAVIYSKKEDFEKAENCLCEAIKLEDKLREIAEDDKNLENIRNENWFIDLINN